MVILKVCSKLKHKRYNYKDSHIEGLAHGPNSLSGRRDSPEAKRLPQELFQLLELYCNAQTP